MQGREVDKISFFQRWSILSGSCEALNLSRRPGICDTVKHKNTVLFIFLPKVTVDCLLSIREALGWMDVGRMGEEGGHYKSACCWWVQEVWADSRRPVFAAFLSSRNYSEEWVKSLSEALSKASRHSTESRYSAEMLTTACYCSLSPQGGSQALFKLINQSWTLYAERQNKLKLLTPQFNHKLEIYLSWMI